MSLPNPPRWAEAFLDIYCDPTYHEEIKGDLYELFDERCAHESVRLARARFAYEVFRFFRWRYLRKSRWFSTTQQHMVKNYLKVSVRQMRKQQLHSFINIGGLALGLVACVLILLYVQYERGYDQFHEKGDRLYQLSQVIKAGPDWQVDSTWYGSVGEDFVVNATVPLPSSKEMATRVPGVARATATNSGEMLFAYGDAKRQEEVLFVEEDFLGMFSFPLLDGDADALTNPQNLVLTQRKAEEFFGAEPAVGKVLEVASWGRTMSFEVGAVVADPPAQSSLQFSVLVPMVWTPGYNYKSTAWDSKQSQVYVELAPGVSVASTRQALTAMHYQYLGDEEDYFQEKLGADSTMESANFHLIPFKDLHVNFLPVHWTTVHPRYLALLTLLAMAILVIASINYISLSLARSAGRNLEVGVRKSMGATHGSIVGQFYIETGLVTLIALVLSTAVVGWVLPGFGEQMGKELHLRDIFKPETIRLLAALMIGTILVAGSYPALYFARFKSVEVLKGRSLYNVRSGFLRVLVTVQLTLTAALLVGALGTYLQVDMMLNKDLGFQVDHIIRVTNAYGEEMAVQEQRLQQMKDRLAQESTVVGVTGIDNSFGIGWSNYGFQVSEDENINVQALRMDLDAAEVLGLKVLEGIPLESIQNLEDKWLVNEAFIEMMGIEQPLGYRMHRGNRPGTPEYEIVGVVNDFNARSLDREISPLLIHFDTNWEGVYNMLIRLEGGHVQEGLEQVAQAWQDVAGATPFEYSFVKDDVQAQYTQYQRQRSLVAYATGLAIIIAFLGLFGLSGIQTVNRRQEVGVRKVLGASLTDIFILLNRQTLLITLLALAVGVPTAAYFLTQWLDAFAYQITLGWQFYTALAGSILVLVLLTVSYYGWRAGRMNPAYALRDE